MIILFPGDNFPWTSHGPIGVVKAGCKASSTSLHGHHSPWRNGLDAGESHTRW